MKNRFVAPLQEAERDWLLRSSSKAQLIHQIAPSVIGSGLVGHQPIVEVLATGFFHRTIGMNLCGSCPVSHDHDVLVSGMESGLLVPILTEPYGQYPENVQAALLGRSHVGRDTMSAFAKAHYCPDHQMGLCRTCGLVSIKRLQANPAAYALAKGHVMPGAAELTPQVGIPATERMMDAKRRLPTIGIVERSAAAMTVERARLLQATAQIRLQHGAAAIHDASTSLGISCPPNVRPAKYLEIVQRHRGELAALSGQSEDDLLATVSQINGEIQSLDSPRGRISQLLVSPKAGRLASAALGAIVGGTIAQGIGAGCGAVAGAIAPHTIRHIADHTLAKCANVSLPAVRTWRIRREMGSIT